MKKQELGTPEQDDMTVRVAANHPAGRHSDSVI
jgi:hypothetical protein